MQVKKLDDRGKQGNDNGQSKIALPAGMLLKIDVNPYAMIDNGFEFSLVPSQQVL